MHVCPSRDLPAIVPVLASQIRMVRSKDPEMICCPSGEYATVITAAACPSRGLPTAAPVSASQIRIVMSSDPEMMFRPSGSKQRTSQSQCAPLEDFQLQHQSPHPRFEWCGRGIL